MSATSTYISEAMRSATGALVERRVSYPIAASDIRRWAIAVYYPDPPPAVFWDEVAAVASPSGGLVAPEEFNPFAWMAADPKGPQVLDRANPDFIERRIGIEGPGLRFQLNGGIEAEYRQPMRPGDTITSERRLSGYTEREGRLGLMLFTTVEDTWTNQNDEVVKRLRQTGIRY
jgi:N-terminal half of MaoC dehydratase